MKLPSTPVFRTLLFVAVCVANLAFVRAEAAIFVREVINKEVNFDEISVGETANFTFSLLGIDLEEAANFTISGQNAACFSVSPDNFLPISKRIDNKNITISYSPDSETAHLAQLAIKSGRAMPILLTLKGVGRYNSTTDQKLANINTQIVARNGEIIVQTDVPQMVEIYDILGQRLSATQVVSGETAISATKNQILIVKTGKTTTKVVVN